MQTAPQKMRGGYTESVWKSLVVKSIRIGWVQGLIEASRWLSPSTMKSLMVNCLFEDIFPAGFDELNDCLNEINRFNFVALCSRETHHGRGYTDDFCDLEKEACTTGKTQGVEIVKELQGQTSLKWLNPRIFNCLYTWWTLVPSDKGVKRKPLTKSYYRMPVCMIDSHTFEGRVKGIKDALLLSGQYYNHRRIGQRVMAEGWDNLRAEALA